MPGSKYLVGDKVKFNVPGMPKPIVVQVTKIRPNITHIGGIKFYNTYDVRVITNDVPKHIIVGVSEETLDAGELDGKIN